MISSQISAQFHSCLPVSFYSRNDKSTLKSSSVNVVIAPQNVALDEPAKRINRERTSRPMPAKERANQIRGSLLITSTKFVLAFWVVDM